jgi:hypothetical protein
MELSDWNGRHGRHAAMAAWAIKAPTVTKIEAMGTSPRSRRKAASMPQAMEMH